MTGKNTASSGLVRFKDPRSLRRFEFRSLFAFTVAIVGAVVVLPTAATAASSTPPAILLGQARSQLSGLIANADAPAQAALTDAVAQLNAAIPQNGGGADLSSLWGDLNNAEVPVPPPYGDAVFTATQAAARDLVSILSDPTARHSTLIAAGGRIVDADYAIAKDVAASSKAPKGSFGTSSPVEISAYQSQWDLSYGKLGRAITTDVTGVPLSTVDQAAEYALESPVEGPNNFVTPAVGSPLTSNGEPEVFYFGAGGLPVLCCRSVVNGGGAFPVRHFLAATAHRVLDHRQLSGNEHIELLRCSLQQPLFDVRPSRGLHKPARLA